MNSYVPTLLSVSVSSGILALLLFGTRFLLKKAGAPKKWIAAMWTLLALRLLVPVTVSLPFSPVPDLTKLFSETVTVVTDEQTVTDPGTLVPSVQEPANDSLADPSAVSPANEQPGTATAPVTITPENAASATNERENAIPTTVTPETKPVPIKLSVSWIVFAIHLAGIVGMTVYFLLSYVRLRKRVSDAIPLEGEPDVFLSDRIDTAFVFGPIRQKIYLPIHMPDAYVKNVLLHERAHISRKDPYWKLLGYVLLSVYWFNPFVWLAYLCFVKDIEFACDEKVVQTVGKDEAKTYAKALLFFSGGKNSPAFCRVAFGEVNMKKRIHEIMSAKKHVAAVSVIALLLAVTFSACLFTTADPSSSEPSTVTPSESESSVVPSEPESTATETEPSETEPAVEPLTEAEIKRLKTLYPQFFGLDTRSGLNVLVYGGDGWWDIRLVPGSQDHYSMFESIAITKQKGMTLDDAKKMLQYYDLPDRKVTLRPYENTMISDYFPSLVEEGGDAYLQQISDAFDGRYKVGEVFPIVNDTERGDLIRLTEGAVISLGDFHSNHEFFVVGINEPSTSAVYFLYYTGEGDRFEDYHYYLKRYDTGLLTEEFWNGGSVAANYYQESEINAIDWYILWASFRTLSGPKNTIAESAWDDDEGIGFYGEGCEKPILIQKSDCCENYEEPEEGKTILYSLLRAEYLIMGTKRQLIKQLD